MNSPFKKLTLVLLFLFIIPAKANDGALKQKISDFIDEIDYYRYELLQKNDKNVCSSTAVKGRVGAKKRGWVYREATTSFRNKKNEAKTNERKALKKFAVETGLSTFWERNGDGFWYYRVIKAERSCLSCHGAKVPTYIKNKYPQGKGHGFKPDQIYALYSVFVKNKKKK